jgi:hypothetical protein
MSFPVVVISPPGTADSVVQEQPRPAPAWRNKTWREAAGQKETAARLERLPPGLALGDDFPEPMAYDPERKLLVYRGFMYHGSYTFLRQLSGDSAYLTALNEIYLTSAYQRPTARTWPRWLAVAAAAALLASLGAWWWLH